MSGRDRATSLWYDCTHVLRAVPEIPEGMQPRRARDLAEPELIDSFLGTGFDFELRLGEHTPIPIDDPEAAERARQFRDVLGIFATGVTVVTSMSGDQPVGMTCQSFSSVSLDPPLVMFCPAKTSRAWPLMRQAGLFCVNFLSADQQHISNGMATKGVGEVRRRRLEARLDRSAADRRRPRVRRLHDRPGPRGRRPLHRGRPGARSSPSATGATSADGSAVPLLFHRGAYTQPE